LNFIPARVRAFIAPVAILAGDTRGSIFMPSRFAVVSVPSVSGKTKDGASHRSKSEEHNMMTSGLRVVAERDFSQSTR